MKKPIKILLTAPPRVGKTTVLNKFIKLYKESLGGIISNEIRDKEGERIGFEVTNLKNKSRILAHKKKTYSGIKVDEYDIDLDCIDNFIIPEIKKSLKENSITLIDEIGRFQSLSKNFLKEIDRILNENSNILGTIIFDPAPWSLPLKNIKGVSIYTLNEKNRDKAPQELVDIFSD